ncbi:hypothetical protein P692DRAFT_20743077 [Suillus brevipes Sb2]|nr:hypothetical protein P692DRAFT_20743077 [Suillus brevipes Sb2]
MNPKLPSPPPFILASSATANKSSSGPKVVGSHRFTMSSLAALHNSARFVPGFSNNERQAAARALLRHDVHIDGAHYQTRTIGGLHPLYIGFNEPTNETDRTLTHSELTEAALQDVFDAITLQDRLDGGISLLIRCAGGEATASISPEQFPVDVYITPRELQESQARIGGDMAVLVQAFAQEFAIPHLQRFTARCAIENVKPPRHFTAAHISASGPQHLPLPTVATGARVQCSAQAPKAFSSVLQSPLPSLDSAAIRHAVELEAKSTKKTVLSLPRSEIRQRRLADVFAKPGPALSRHGGLICDPFISETPLISIGPNTDVALDQLKMGDENLPRLRSLVGSVRSSRWEAVLRSPAWDLTYDKASILSDALLADLQGMKAVNPEITSLAVSDIPFLTFLKNLMSGICSTDHQCSLPS